ncbi:hypothetical protein HGRIS_001644 [Hohenbuehelia grisea]|uniref:Uncharacterized protein n=1 Tax=Hohenbuehelia grisea TaxID=104357 RepID=A0ABR3JJ09_9AGAR
MGRPRLYHTTEQQRIANRAKALRSYYKNKTAISARRSSRYREQQRRPNSSEEQQGASAPTPEPPTHPTAAKACPLALPIIDEFTLSELQIQQHQQATAIWLQRVDRLYRKFEKAVGYAPRVYLNSIAEAYLLSASKALIRDAISDFERLARHGSRYKEALLVPVGHLDDDTIRLFKLHEQILETVACLKEMLCTAMMGSVDEFRTQHVQGRFRYQLY